MTPQQILIDTVFKDRIRKYGEFEFYPVKIANEYLELVLYNKEPLGLFDDFNERVNGIVGGYCSNPATFYPKQTHEEYRVYLEDGTRIGPNYNFISVVDVPKQTALKRKYQTGDLVFLLLDTSDGGEVAVTQNGKAIPANEALRKYPGN